MASGRGDGNLSRLTAPINGSVRQAGGVNWRMENRDISGWTVETLHAHIKAVMDERDKRYEAALASAALAVEKAEGIADRWREHANEWRAAMTDKDKNFLTKDVARGYFVTGLMAAGVMIAIAELFARLLFR